MKPLLDDRALKQIMLKMTQDPTANIELFCNNLGIDKKEFLDYLQDDTRDGKWLHEIFGKIHRKVSV
jgi:hypothetical protein